ncbi:uncharacterized protein LOC128865881 [Anastrepha ludens]|uniref:uncharacterized protein LOC128865881 n=1 Tax=Anastrepha ludens TaxID=28586 RepID=UPI0023B1F643|nr:uncharacterized protein LOC128865881 [Anastrepha ludens]
MRLLNVISIYRDYVDDGHFYTFSYFPQFHVQCKTLKEDCFPDRIRDMKGVAIRFVPESVEPWIIVWRDQFGHFQVTGFVAKLLREFAKRNNGTLTYSVIDNLTPVPNVLALLKNDTADIVTGIGSSSLKTPGVDTSTPLLSIDWIIITNVVLRSIIGQPSCSVVHLKAKFTKRFIYIFLLLSGIFMSTFIAAGLKSYLTSNPHKYSRLTTFEEFINSEIKIKVSQRLYSSVAVFIDLKYVGTMENKFIIEPSLELLQHQRSSLDTRFGYPVADALWKALSRHQSYLPRPLFYVSEKIDVVKNLLLSIPLQEHSIYKEALNNMIHQAQSIGLTDLWTRQIYDDMLVAKIINRTIVKPAGYEPLDLEHFHWLWWMYGFGVSLSVLGIIWSTVYSAQLNGFFSRPTSGEQINTYDDLKMRGIQIAIPLEEFELLEKFMSKSFMRTYRDIFFIIPELRDFYTLQEVQFHRQTLLAVPLAENSVYRASFNAYLLDMQAYGFWNHWAAMSLFEMVEARKLSLEDFVEPLGYKALQLRDLYYI